MDFLSNFSSSRPGRVAIWRETLPQHFKTVTGIYEGKTQFKCGAALKNNSFNPGTQGYNAKALAVFAEFCNCSKTTPGRDHFENGTLCLAYECKVSHTATNVSYESVFSWEARYNYTHYGNSGSPVRPESVYWWPLFDLFDVPTWHHSDKDCSHFCFIPQLYDEGFSRLSAILNLTSF